MKKTHGSHQDTPSGNPPEVRDRAALYARGLTTEEVRQRQMLGYGNTGTGPQTRSAAQIVRENLLTYYNLVFAVLALLLILVGSFRDLTFLPVVAVNAGIGIYQGLRAKNIMDRLHLMAEPKVSVLRDGCIREVLPQELVLDDIVELHSGMPVPADAQVFDGEIRVNEALLTGEADEIAKGPGDALLSGSVVVSGCCRARLVQVGAESYIGHLTRQATGPQRGEASALIRSLNRLVCIAGILILPMGLLLFVQQYRMGAGIRASVIAVVAAVVGMIPEGLYLLSSLTMMVSALRLASNRVLVHDMKCIEALARTDLLCVDKTGTITAPDMEVVQVIPCGDVSSARLHQLLCTLTRYMTADNATMEALQCYFSDTGDDVPDQTVPFSPEYKYCSMKLQGTWYGLGAPERLLDEPQSADTAEFLRQGYRVLAFVCAEGPLTGQTPVSANLLGWVLLNNPIRPQAAAAFAYFAENGVAVKVISGDHPEAAAHAAALAGIPYADRWVDATALNTDEQLVQAVLRCTVFGRVTPTQKQAIIRVLKKSGRTVGMVGDGVNDVLALREADCSAAMASGSEAAAQIAQLVLLESDFSRMPAVVAEGRRVINNIQRSAGLFLIKNIYSFLLTLFSLVFGFAYPLQPSQLSLVSLFTIGIPSFLLAMESNTERIKGRFLPSVLRTSAPAAVTAFLCTVFLVIYGRAAPFPAEMVSTQCALLMAFVGFAALVRIAAPLNLRRLGMILLMLLGLICCALGLHRLFALSPLDTAQQLLMVPMCVSALMVYRSAERLTERLWRRWEGNRLRRSK